MRATADALARMPGAAAKMEERRRKRGEGGALNRVILEGDRLFDFVLLEQIEREEIRQERLGLQLTQADLTKRFVKHPIRFGTNRTAFYAAAGMCFGLSHYRGSELQALYRAIAPESSTKGDRECCRAKKLLHQSLVARFGRVAVPLSVSESTGAPLRLSRSAPGPELLALMKQGLALYMADTPTLKPNTLGSRYDTPFVFTGKGDHLELERISVFFNLESFRHLTERTAMESFDKRARTILLRGNDTEPTPAGHPDDVPINQIRELVDQDSARRHSLRGGPVRVCVDGITRATLNGDGAATSMILEESATFVELLCDAPDGNEVAIGTYVLTYDGEKQECWRVNLPWNDSDRITANFDYGDDGCVAATIERSATRGFVVIAGDRLQEQKTSEFNWLSPGTQVGRYIIGDLLSVDDTLEAYRAIDKSADRIVVLKRCSTRVELEDHERLVRRFRSDGNERVRRVACIWDAFVSDNQACLVRDFVDGQTIDEWSHEESREPFVVLQCGLSLLDDLELMHRCGFVHRDIKPTNVLVDRRGSVRLLDCGLGRNSFNAGSRLLSHRYLAPEYSSDTADTRSDLFSLGVVLYELLTGYHPFVSSSTVTGQVTGVIRPVAPQLLNPYLPQELGDVIVKAINLDPDSRFQTTSSFKSALARCMRPAVQLARTRRRDDQKLMEFFVSGRTDALEVIHRRYLALVRGQLTRLGCDTEDQDRLVSSVFADLICQIRHYRDAELGLAYLSHRSARMRLCAWSQAICIREIDRSVSRESDAAQKALTMVGYLAFRQDVGTKDSTMPRVKRKELGPNLVGSEILVGALTLLFGARTTTELSELLASLASAIGSLRRSKSASVTEELDERSDEVAQLRNIYLDPAQYADGGCYFGAPVDWREVVPLGRLLLVCHNSAEASEFGDKLLPASTFRPAVSQVVRCLSKG